MCGRFAIDKVMAELAKIYQATAASGGFNGSFNVAPTELAPIIFEKDLDREVRLAKFGQLMKHGTKTFPLINIQSEKAAVRKDFITSRCIIPATGFYEWVAETPKEKQPYYFSPAVESVFSFAGLWREDASGASFSILTTKANGVVDSIHNRMPVILSGNAMGEWLAPNATKDTLSELMRPLNDNLMQVWKVSKTVNSPKNKEAVCVNSL